MLFLFIVEFLVVSFLWEISILISQKNYFRSYLYQHSPWPLLVFGLLLSGRVFPLGLIWTQFFCLLIHTNLKTVCLMYFLKMLWIYITKLLNIHGNHQLPFELGCQIFPIIAKVLEECKISCSLHIYAQRNEQMRRC